MVNVSFEEYIENKHTYKNGDIIPMKMNDIKKVAKLHSAQLNAEENDKEIYHFIELETDEQQNHIRSSAIMQIVTLLCVLIALFKNQYN